MKVIKVESLGLHDVYDLHIDHIDHSFFCQDIPVHNSGLCHERDGRKFYMPIDEITKDNKPPIHFNCRSKLVAGNKYSRQDGTRASQFGAVPSTETYSTWFAKQSPAFQKSVLGGKYNAYKSGVYKIGGLPDVLGKKIDLDKFREYMENYVK